MNRKIIQITVIESVKYNRLCALCDDGTVWVRERAGSADKDERAGSADKNWTWVELDISQISKPTTVTAIV